MFVAPTGKLTVACRAFVMFDTLRELGHLELHPLWSDTLTQLGSAARRVAFPSGLPKGAAVPSAVMRHVPHMMFSHAQQLLLQGAGADSITLPSVFLSHISDRNFPRVYTMDLGEARGVRQEAVSKAVDLKLLRLIRFERRTPQLGWFLFPLCLARCGKTGPTLTLSAHYDNQQAPSLSVRRWSLWERGGAQKRGIEKRVERIDVHLRWCHKGNADESRLLSVCLEAIDKCPFLDCICLHGFSLDQLGSDIPGKHALFSHGFVAVQKTYDCLELCRVFGCVFPRCMAEHVSPLPASAVLAPPRSSMDDSASLSEAVLSHIGVRFPRLVARHLRKEREKAIFREVRAN